MEQNERKFESYRCGGTEILRAGSILLGFDAAPERIAEYYRSLAAASVKGALERLGPLAERDFWERKAENARLAAYYKRQNYLFFCEAQAVSDGFLKVKTVISLTDSRKDDFRKILLHVWDMKCAALVFGKKRKKLLGKEEIVKK